MKNIIDIIENAVPKCNKLDINSFGELTEIMFVSGQLIPFDRFEKRIWDTIAGDDPELSLVDYISSLWDISKSEVRRLMKNNGIKVNNNIANPDMLIKNLPWIELDNDWKVCIIKKGKNQFDFVLS